MKYTSCSCSFCCEGISIAWWRLQRRFRTSSIELQQLPVRHEHIVDQRLYQFLLYWEPKMHETQAFVYNALLRCWLLLPIAQCSMLPHDFSHIANALVHAHTHTLNELCNRAQWSHKRPEESWQAIRMQSTTVSILDYILASSAAPCAPQPGF